MEDKEKELERLANLVKSSADFELFESFIEAFKSAEEEHIRKALNPEDPKDFNLRSAALCAEAYAAADLMLSTIKGEE
jgi:hypothetical protein